jgi:lipoprotein-anchoring transpeptidase ErfK/SrfK
MFRLAVLVVALFGLATPTLAAGHSTSFADFFSLSKTGKSHRYFGGTPESLTITVNISTQEMVVADEDGDAIFTFDVSTGRPGHATPTGTFRPLRMHQMWYSSKYENAPMPWSIFFYGGYAIHGTTDLKHLGTVASHGCVRLDPKNAKLLYDLVKEVGMKSTTVRLVRT